MVKYRLISLYIRNCLSKKNYKCIYKFYSNKAGGYNAYEAWKMVECHFLRTGVLELLHISFIISLPSLRSVVVL